MVETPSSGPAAPPFWSGDAIDERMRSPAAMRELIARVGEAFAAVSRGECLHPPRGAVGGEAGTTLLMGAAIEGLGRTAKVVSVFPDNPSRGLPSTLGLLLALDPRSGAPLAIMDAARLTAWRTGAASGLATDLCAAPDATRLGLIGAGAQAFTQACAVCAVREIEEISVFARNRQRALSSCRELEARLGRRVQLVDSVDELTRRAQVLCVATTSSEPVLDGRTLRPGTHVNGVGSFRLDMRELDRHTIARARVLVDEIAAAKHESGELVDALEAGITDEAAWTEIGELVADSTRLSPASDERDITVFKSVGHPSQDVAFAAFMLGNDATKP